MPAWFVPVLATPIYGPPFWWSSCLSHSVLEIWTCLEFSLIRDQPWEFQSKSWTCLKYQPMPWTCLPGCSLRSSEGQVVRVLLLLSSGTLFWALGVLIRWRSTRGHPPCFAVYFIERFEEGSSPELRLVWLLPTCWYTWEWPFGSS